MVPGLTVVERRGSVPLWGGADTARPVLGKRFLHQSWPSTPRMVGRAAASLASIHRRSDSSTRSTCRGQVSRWPGGQVSR